MDENLIRLPFDARNQIERMLIDIVASNPIGTAAQMMRLLMSWQEFPAAPSIATRPERVS